MFRSNAVAVTTSAAVLITPKRPTSNAPQTFIIYNNDGAETLYVGGDDVTAANGIPVGPGKYLPLVIIGQDDVWAVGSGALDARIGGTLEGSD